MILSDVDGLYAAEPQQKKDGTHIPVVDAITPEIEEMAEGPNASAGVGSGGMESKIAAAKIAGKNGCATIIAPGVIDHPLAAIAAEGKATLISPANNSESARRQWIGGRLKSNGHIEIDAGAANALAKGASLLPAGITKVSGDFLRGDAVVIVNEDGGVLGQGLSAYAADDVKKIAGKKSEELEQILGYRRRPAVIEKNDLVLRTE